MKLFAKFGWNWPSGSKEDKNVKFTTTTMDNEKMILIRKDFGSGGLKVIKHQFSIQIFLFLFLFYLLVKKIQYHNHKHLDYNKITINALITWLFIFHVS